jgi:hypothetical protein
VLHEEMRAQGAFVRVSLRGAFVWACMRGIWGDGDCRGASEACPGQFVIIERKVAKPCFRKINRYPESVIQNLSGPPNSYLRCYVTRIILKRNEGKERETNVDF